ncbi:Hypothetical protein, predicted transmembrane protein [Mycoplasma yeatsii 13926]|uniref:Transmembrane protein n=1 Tax=Mycoplasma yeatsii 13926 TaxID=1188240 RepID=S6G8K8_9MOLU|nr:hypothetical protein [Mycoplasma yeatsii]EOA07514.1 Hypothetical protein, predicted transmembrane protein [Mycoplasma yeatsii 13926]
MKKKHLLNFLSTFFMFILVIIANESFGYGNNQHLHVLGKQTTPYALAVTGFVFSGLCLIIPFLLTFIKSKKIKKHEKLLIIINISILILATMLLIIAVPFFIAALGFKAVAPGLGIIILYLVGLSYALPTHLKIILENKECSKDCSHKKDKEDKDKEEKDKK